MADRYWVGGGSNSGWAATGNTNWSTASGGANNASVPTSADNVIFDGVGVNANGLSTIVTGLTILSLNITSGYTGTMTHNALLTVTNNITLNNNYTVAGTSGIVSNSTATLTSNGKVFPNNLAFFAGTKTLADNWVINGVLTTTGSTICNGNTLSCKGLTSTNSISGTTTLILTSGSWSGAGTVSNNITFLGGTITIGSITYGTGTILYQSGTVSHAGSLNLVASCTINTPVANLSWETLNMSANNLTLTISSPLYAYQITVTGNNTVSFLGTAGWECDEFSNVATSAVTVTLKDGNTYGIFSFINFTTARAGTILITSSHASNRANIYLYPEYIAGVRTLCNVNCNFTRINATGRTLRSFNGVITDCINIVSITDLKTVAATF